MHELIIDLQEGQETGREVILKALRYYMLSLPFAKLSARYDASAYKLYV
jgi:hypothetical protein